MNSEEGKELRKKAERDRDGKYRSRAHSKAEKRKQRKAWKKRKQKEGGENKETTLIADVQEIPDAEPPAKTKREEQTIDRLSIRGTYLVKLSKIKYQHKHLTGERHKQRYFRTRNIVSAQWQGIEQSNRSPVLERICKKL